MYFGNAVDTKKVIETVYIMIDVSNYAGMLLDQERIKAFVEAIPASVGKGDTVADVGSGLGTYAMAAARAGAQKVFAVEKGSVFPLLKSIIQKNNLSDIVKLVKADMEEWCPPEKIDLVIFEDFPSQGISSSTLSILKSAREACFSAKFLPETITIKGAPVRLPMNSKLREMLKASYRIGGFDFTDLSLYVSDSIHPVELNAASFMGEPCEIWSFPLGAPPSSFSSEMLWTITPDGECDGIALWFELDLGAGIKLSNAPGTAITSWGQTLFPLLHLGSATSSFEISLKIEFFPAGNVWNWSASWLENREAHSTAFSLPLDKKAFLNWDLPIKTRPNPEGEVAKLVLLSAEKGMTPNEIYDIIELKMDKGINPDRIKALIRSVIGQYLF